MSSAMDDDSIHAPTAPELDAYDLLAVTTRMVVTRKEWLWLSDAEKASLENDLCEPEY